MKISRPVFCLLLIFLIMMIACDNRSTPSPPPPASPENLPGPEINIHTPVSPTIAPTSSNPAPTPTAFAEGDLESIDKVLEEINNDVCREAHITRAEISELMAAGHDVAELEEAIIELINELENCSLEITPVP